MPQPKDIISEEISNIRLKLLDPLGRGITHLEYEVKQGARTVAKGITDAKGSLAEFKSSIGSPITVHVKRFIGDELKEIKTLTPWAEKFSLKLVSSKIKEALHLDIDEGTPGRYRRKTYQVKEGDTLLALAAEYKTTDQAIATLNDISVGTPLRAGQILKLPPLPYEKTKSLPESKADRGENGTPKSTVNLGCDQKGCVKVGDKGPLVEEINIRLMGFGNTVDSSKPYDEFSAKTENAVKQFQRDYMGVPETGKVCGSVLVALDEFRDKYPIALSDMKCCCGKCGGFGNNYQDSSKADFFQPLKTIHDKKRPYIGTEYPGIHRALIWAFRAALFYTCVKDKTLEYSFLKIASGYRCWHNNKQHNRKTTNHMGNAIDIQFKKGKSSTRCGGADVDEIRAKIFIGRLGAQLGWKKANLVSLESAAQGATTWVHADVRELANEFKHHKYYAVSQSAADGDRLIEIAKREGRLNLINCGGIPPNLPPARTEERIPVNSLSLSEDGLTFIKGWEKLSLRPYNDSEGFCTVGWGHLIARSKCEALEKDADEDFEPFKNGIDEKEASRLLLQDIRSKTRALSDYVQVPLFQYEYDALVSLLFNIGSFRKCPKLLAKLNTKDYSGCCDEFADITNGGTAGLVKRRTAEMKLFRNNIYDCSH